MMLHLEKSSILLYAQVEAVLAADIAVGTLTIGSQLPTEDCLIARFGVSRITVRKAIQNLVARGLIEIQRGKGTFVTQPKISQELTELCGFVEDMQALGRNPTARLIDKCVVPASEDVAQRLAVATGTLVVRIQRVRFADGVAMSFDETYLPLEIGKKIVTNDLEVEPIFSLLEQKYNIPLVEAEYRLEAVASETQISEALGIEAGSPIFMIERTSYTTANEPIDYERLHYRGDLIRFVTRLARNTTSATTKKH
jgi:GntR family transcriptional regulator